nr:cyclodeaminase/cyclohydrolase family protein [Prolixibacteraceae bacterium]
SDAGVGALAARAAVSGAFLNVRINAKGYSDKNLAARLLDEGKQIEQSALQAEAEILKRVSIQIDAE